MIIFFLTLIGIAVTVTLATIIFVKSAPQFGQPPSGAHLDKIKKSPQF